MAKRQVSRSVSDRALRAALTARARPLRLAPAQAAGDQPARLAAAVRDRIDACCAKAVTRSSCCARNRTVGVSVLLAFWRRTSVGRYRLLAERLRNG